MKPEQCPTWNRLKNEVKEPMQRMQRQMSELLEERIGPCGANPRMVAQQRLAAFVPSIDLFEGDNAYTVTAELPGVPVETVKVTMVEQKLVIDGKKTITPSNGKSVFRERMSGPFRRVIRFPEEVDEARVLARSADGVLTVTIPKASAGGTGRTVEIATDA